MFPRKDPSVSALFPALCVVIVLVLLSSMPIYRGLESSFSATRGLGAAMTMLRDELESNETVAAFLGLDTDDTEETIWVSAQPAREETADFDLDAAVAAYIEAHTPPFVLPLNGAINSGYGARTDPFAAEGLRLLGTAPIETHRGIDISAANGTDVRAAMDGVVRFVGSDPSYGNYLILTHDDCETLYAHCAAISVTAGQPVHIGEQIAVAGATGRATGVHLHFEVLLDGISVDPLAYFGFYEATATT